MKIFGTNPLITGLLAAGVISGMLLIAPAASGQQQTGDGREDAPPPPEIREPLPPKVQDPGDQLEPQVVIRREERQTVEEYRSGGRVYMVRIVPAVGPPYYLLDTTGDGLLDMRHDHMSPVKPAHWKIFEW